MMDEKEEFLAKQRESSSAPQSPPQNSQKPERAPSKQPQPVWVQSRQPKREQPGRQQPQPSEHSSSIPDKPEPSITSIAITQNDDPWAANLDDRLDANDEAKAFARLAVAKDFTPPLAIGLFGNWGSGKSFFMRLVYQHVELLCKGNPRAQAPEAGSAAFHTDVVQVRFNAWHYVETHLWASLVDHLFSELDRWYTRRNPQASDPLLEHLSTSRMLTLEAAQELVRRRHDQRVASQQLLQAQKELEEAQAKTASSPTVYLAAVRELFKTPNPASDVEAAKTEFKDAAKILGMDTFAASCEGFRQVSSALHSEASRTRLLADGFKFQLLDWKNVAVFLLIVLSLPWLAATGMVWLKDNVPFLKSAHEYLMLLSVVVAAATTQLRFVWGKVRGALTQLENGKAALDRVIERQLSAQNAVFQRAQQEVAKVNASVDEAKALVQATSERLALATHDYSQGTGAGRLKKFVRARATDGEYAQHLGLIATVRKDFEELAFNVADPGSPGESVIVERAAFEAKMDAFLIANQSLLDPEDIERLRSTAKHSPAEVRSFKRIVLYIDDLDRCPPEKVVEVLQAVHLLLTFPLFVVMVAVDVRWVRKALIAHYPTLLTENGQGNGTASVSDYLEKIFQIPYWMRPMDRTSGAQFLQGRLDRSKGVEKVGSNVGTSFSGGEKDKETEGVTTQMLDISDDETNALQKLVPYVGSSPRRALRFLNVYRLIKASLKAEEIRQLESGEYKVLLTLLAMAMGTPYSFSILQRKVGESIFSITDFQAVVTSGTEGMDESNYLKEILALYLVPAAKTNADVKLQMKKYTSIVRRYSFDG